MKRIRLVIDDQLRESLDLDRNTPAKRLAALDDTKMSTVSDLLKHALKVFKISSSDRHRVDLCIGDYHIDHHEPIDIFRDEDKVHLKSSELTKLDDTGNLMNSCMETSSIHTDTEQRDSHGLEISSCSDSSVASSTVRAKEVAKLQSSASSSRQPSCTVSEVWKQLTMRQNSASSNEQSNQPMANLSHPSIDDKLASSKRRRRKKRKRSSSSAAAATTLEPIECEEKQEVDPDPIQLKEIGEQLEWFTFVCHSIGHDMSRIGHPIDTRDVLDTLKPDDFITWAMNNRYEGDVFEKRFWYQGRVHALDNCSLLVQTLVDLENKAINMRCLFPSDVEFLYLVDKSDLLESQGFVQKAIDDDEIQQLIEQKRLSLLSSDD